MDARRANVTTRDIGSRWEDAVLAHLQRAGENDCAQFHLPLR
jgi:hypothetical protein